MKGVLPFLLLLLLTALGLGLWAAFFFSIFSDPRESRQALVERRLAGCELDLAHARLDSEAMRRRRSETLAREGPRP